MQVAHKSGLLLFMFIEAYKNNGKKGHQGTKLFFCFFNATPYRSFSVDFK